MLIKTASGEGGPRYLIQEHAGADSYTLAAFDTLEIAGVVLRYLKGSVRRAVEQETAVNALREYDRRSAAARQ